MRWSLKVTLLIIGTVSPLGDIDFERTRPGRDEAQQLGFKHVTSWSVSSIQIICGQL